MADAKEVKSKTESKSKSLYAGNNVICDYCREEGTVLRNCYNCKALRDAMNNNTRCAYPGCNKFATSDNYGGDSVCGRHYEPW